MDSLTHKIHIKGYVPEMFFDTQTLRRYADISFNNKYKTIIFNGTNEELDDFISHCIKDETYFKITGVD